MSDLWTVGINGTLYEIRGTRLFIDDEEALPINGRPWKTAAEARNAADSFEVGDTDGLGRLKRSDWKKRKAAP